MTKEQKEELGLSDLESLLYNHPKPEVRHSAGEKIIEHYVKKGSYESYRDLVCLSKDKKVPEKIRELAGEKVIEYYVQKRSYKDLVDLSKDKEVPKKVRQLAGENIIKNYL